MIFDKYDQRTVGTFSVIALVIIGALIIIREFDIYYPVHVTTSARSAELSVIGEGKIEVVPDTATVTAGIVVQNAPSVDAARARMDEVNNNIVAEMRKLGIEEEMITTTNYSVYPNYTFEDQRSINGYNAEATVSVKTHDVDQVPEITSSALQAGANQIQGAQFSIDDPAKYRELARDRAINNAKEQAEKLASQLDIKLGKITNIVESSPDGVVMPFMARAEGLGGGIEPDIQPGSQTISSVVTLYFEKR